MARASREANLDVARYYRLEEEKGAKSEGDEGEEVGAAASPASGSEGDGTDPEADAEAARWARAHGLGPVTSSSPDEEEDASEDEDGRPGGGANRGGEGRVGEDLFHRGADEVGTTRGVIAGQPIEHQRHWNATRHLRDMTRPCPCGVDDDVGGAIQAARFDMPDAIAPHGMFQPAVAMWLNALLARLAQIGRVKRGDINIRTGRFP